MRDQWCCVCLLTSRDRPRPAVTTIAGYAACIEHAPLITRCDAGRAWAAIISGLSREPITTRRAP